MKQIYDQNITNQIRKRILVETIIIILSLILTSLAIIGLYYIRAREYVVLLALFAALITTCEIIFVTLYSVFSFLCDIEYNRFIKRMSTRRFETVNGIFVKCGNEKYTYKRVTYDTFQFDCGDTYRGDKVYRTLYLQQNLNIKFEENKEYKLNVADNHILFYEEL